MTVNLDISGDFVAIIDNPMTCQVVLRPESADRETIDIATCQSFATKTSQIFAVGLSMDVPTQNWLIPDILLNPNGEGRRIGKGDLVIDNTVRPFVTWRVAAVSEPSMGNSRSTWRCICGRQGV